MNKIILKPRNKPILIDEDIWFYKNKRSLSFVVWQVGRDNKKICTQFRLPMKLLENN